MSGSNDITLAIIGSVGTGKSALTISFVNNVFIDMYDPTIEDSFRKQVDVDGRTVMLTILDTAGAEEFHSIRDMNMAQSHGVLVVFSICDQPSFEATLALYRDALRAHCEPDELPCVLVATKCDLNDARVVSKEQAQQRAAEMKCPFVETSAKANIGVTDVFHTAVRQVWSWRERHAPGSAPTSKKKGCQLL